MYVDSPTCLAAHLRNQGLLDTFRERRPNLKAYTYYSHSGSASRLDAIWWFPSADQETQVLNAATLWLWERRVDHDPVVADFDIRLPQLPTPKPEPPLHWRQLVRRLSLDLPSLVSGNLEPHQSTLQQLSQELDAAGAAWQALPQPPCEGLDGVFGTVALATPSRLLLTVHQIHDKLMQILLACLPPPVPTASRQQARVSSAWQACLLELRRVKRAVQDDAFLSRGGFRPSSISITALAEAWCKAMGITAHQQERTECPALPAWDLFLSNPSEWARGLGLPAVSHHARAAVDVRLPVAEPTQPALLTWDVLLARGATHSRCIAVLEELIAFATAKHTSLSRLHMRGLREQRQQLLRDGDISAWARKMRPMASPSAKYTPEWVSAEDGTRRRPTSHSDVLTGARQEWSRLLHEPPRPWSHDLVLTFNSPLLQQRGAIHFVRLAQTFEHSRLASVGKAFMEPGPWKLCRVQPRSVQVLPRLRLVIGPWVLWSEGNSWWASRPGPCPGPTFRLVSVGGVPAHLATMDHLCSHQAPYALILRQQEPPSYAPVAPTTDGEQRLLLTKFRHSRPGPSGWKVCYLGAFPDEVQQLYWRCLNALRLFGTVPPSLLCSQQVHLAKPAGGWRPLSMLEENIKAVEAPVAARLAAQRSPWHSDAPRSQLNRAYSKGVSAASEVLYLDCLICEDSLRSGLPLLRIPADYEKFFNVLQLTEVDAVQQGRGVPDAVRRLHHALFSGMQVALSTRAGFTQPVNVERGVPQGAVTSPEVSRSAQDPILRLRAADGAAYVSSAGRRVTAAGYVDDIEHYGQGLADLPIILNSLEAGSRASGVGFAWSKFSAFASDWDAGLPLLPAGSGVTAAGASVRSWDIWSGGMRAFQLPRSTAQDVDKLLGKRGTPSDRHTLAREDLLAKLASVRQRLSTKCCAWDEITAMAQWVLGGVMGYGPLLGVPSPANLHREDAALHRLLHASLGVRSTCERVSFSASRSVGGLGALGRGCRCRLAGAPEWYLSGGSSRARLPPPCP